MLCIGFEEGRKWVCGGGVWLGLLYVEVVLRLSGVDDCVRFLLLLNEYVLVCGWFWRYWMMLMMLFGFVDLVMIVIILVVMFSLVVMILVFMLLVLIDELVFEIVIYGLEL